VPTAPAAGPLPGPGQAGRDRTRPCSRTAAAERQQQLAVGCSHPSILQTPGSRCPEEHLGEDVAFFSSRARLKGCESWQDAQPSCLLRKGAVTSEQVSCVPRFLHCGRVGCVSPALGLPHPTPWYPPNHPTWAPLPSLAKHLSLACRNRST